MEDKRNPLRAHASQIILLVIVNLFVGGMVDLERTVLPLVAKVDFGIVAKTAAIGFIVSFGIVKALSNLFQAELQIQLVANSY